MIILKNTQYKSIFDTYTNVINPLIFFALLSLPSLASARADIDLSDLGENTNVSVLLASIGIYGMITCYRHLDLVNLYTDNINGILKWILRVALLLLLLPIVGDFIGFYFEKDAGVTLLGVWGALKAAQGLYISGVAEGIRRTKNE